MQAKTDSRSSHGSGFAPVISNRNDGTPQIITVKWCCLCLQEARRPESPPKLQSQRGSQWGLEPGCGVGAIWRWVREQNKGKQRGSNGAV